MIRGHGRTLILLMFLLIILPLAYSKNAAGTYKNIDNKIASDGSANVIILFDDASTSHADTDKSDVHSDSYNINSVHSKMERGNMPGFHKKSYLKIINGYSGTLTESGLQALKDSGVKFTIYEDKILHVTPISDGDNAIVAGNLSVATSEIGANYSWNVLNITGSNITVAIIDTGITYTHPDLGGCFGFGTNASCRVFDGYDFVNNDNDPMDDFGHGTHVAGILGANGTLRGTAPDVRFYALKACNSQGSCPTSDILESIDWAVNHSANIISMSIGAYASDDNYGNSGKDPLSLALNNAVAAGVVVVVSAGNDGPGVSTIDNPGSAENVITVGAINDSGTINISDDTVASFSSRGPSAFGRLDPDIVAPGVNINSTWINNSYNVLSGTSMATPFVSGAAALLLEYYKNLGVNLTPMQVRSILISSSSNVSGKIFERGVGILNIQNALSSGLMYSVSHVNAYGQSVIDDRWEFLVTPNTASYANITIANNNNYNVTLNSIIDIIQNMENNITLNSSQLKVLPNVTIVNNSNFTIQLNFTLDNFTTTYATTYGGIIILNGTGNNGTTNISKSIRIPLVITVPMQYSVSLNRTMYNSANAPFYTDEDVYYYAYYHNSSEKMIVVNVSWYNGSDNLNLYLYNSTGDFDNNSKSGVGTLESVGTVKNDTVKWFRIDGYTFVSPITFNITVTMLNDTTPPIISNPSPNSAQSYTTTSVILSVNTDESATCRYNLTDISYDNMTGLFNDNVTIHTASYNVSSGTSYTIYVRCRDTLNNTDNSSVTISFSVDSVPPPAPVSHGGGGGGGSAFVPSNPNSVTQSVDVVRSGEYNISIYASNIPLSQLTLESSSESRNVIIKVSKEDSPVSEYPDKVYSYLEINHTNLPEDYILEAKLYFSVSKSWLDNNSIGEDSISLFRYSNETYNWTELSTEIMNEDASNVYYVAYSPGLSLYAISKKTISIDNQKSNIITNDTTKNQTSQNGLLNNSTMNNTVENSTRNNTPHITSNNKNTPQLSGQTAISRNTVIEIIVLVLFSVFILVLILGIIIRNRGIKRYEKDIIDETNKEFKNTKIPRNKLR